MNSIAPTPFRRALLGGALLAVSSAVQAQVANVAVIERVVEKRAGQAGSWKDAKSGTPLVQNDALRTGKRSKADVKFRDGSLVRLGQISSLEIQSTAADNTRVRLQDGKVIFVKVPGGGGTSRVLTGSGAAEIKGSIVVVQNLGGGIYEYSAYAGTVEIVGFDGNGQEKGRITLKPGFAVKTFQNGDFSQVYQAAPLVTYSDLLSAPADSPFVGSKEQVTERLDPKIVALDGTLVTINVEGQTKPRLNPFIPRGPFPDTEPPFGGPFPPPAGGYLVRRDTLVSAPAASQLGGVTSASANSGNARSMAAQATAPITGQIRLAQAPNVKPDAGQAAQNSAQNVTAAEAGAPDLDLGPALKHLKDPDLSFGKISGFDYRAIGFVGDNNLRAGFGRLHAFTRQGRWAADLVATPQDIRFDTPLGRIQRDNVLVSQATFSYRARSGDIIMGRQRFLSAPIRAAFYGSLQRQGGRDTMDAVRFIPRLGKRYGAEISYLYDAYPRDLPYRIRDNQQGLFARAYTQQKYGNFGINLLRYRTSPVPDRTGVSLDFALPVWRNKVDVYGEVGTDPFKRKLRTYGVTVPWLYQQTGLDLYVERARLTASPSAQGMGGEWAVRMYRSIGDGIDVVGAYNKFDGGTSSFLVGVSIGGRTLLHSK